MNKDKLLELIKVFVVLVIVVYLFFPEYDHISKIKASLLGACIYSLGFVWDYFKRKVDKKRA